MLRTLDQRRAAHAWAAVQQVVRKDWKKKYGGQAKKMPIRILGAGLGQAAAFVLAKSDDNKKVFGQELLQDLGDWLLDKRANAASTRDRPAADALIKRIIDGNADQLRQLTDEALAWLQWLNRFAEAADITDDED